jgi:exopolysaccharide production protein ExoY
VVQLRYAYLVERIAAAVVLVALSPVLVVIGIVIAVLSRSGPLVRHARVGWNGRPLYMLKFRTMWERGNQPARFRMVEDVSGPPPIEKQACDARINSGFAVFCRRYSLDELPQLVHVAIGEMSLVGPRPITRAELEEHYAECMEEVLSLRPGITGLWQVRGRNELTYAARRRLDRIFVRRASVGLYFWVLVRSVPGVVSGRGAF